MQKILVIHNPYSGKQKHIQKTIKEMKKIAFNNGYDIEFIKTTKKHDATKIIQNVNEQYDIVLSMGGDGTFNEVVTGNVKRDTPFLLGHIPVGTTNDLKSSFGLSGNVLQSFESILKGKEVSYDVLSLNNTPFTYTAGFGKLLNIPYDTKKKDKMKFGYFAYINNGIFDILTKKIKLYHVKYEIGGVINEITTPLILVSNSNHMAGMKFYDDAKLNDDKFEVLIANTNSIIKLAIGLLQIKTKKNSKYYKLIKTDNIKFTIKDSQDFKNWCIDGEKFEDKPNIYDIKVLKKIKCKVAKEADYYIWYLLYYNIMGKYLLKKSNINVLKL